MEINNIELRTLINVINKELEIIRLKIDNSNDLLDKSYLVNLQALRNKLENSFLDKVIDREDK